MRQISRSVVRVSVLAVALSLLMACGSGGIATTAQQETPTADSSSSGNAGDEEHENTTALPASDASESDGAEANADHDDGDAKTDHGDDHSGDDPMAVASAHGIPKEAAAVPNPIPYGQESVAAGAVLFSQSCSVCHGPKGEGDGPGAAGLDPKPAALTAEHVQANSDGALFYTISNGRPDTAMVAWAGTYSETGRWHLVNFVRSLVEE